MNLPAAASLVAAAIGFFFAFLSVGFASAPGWKELRWFALIAATAAAYDVCDLAPSIGASDRVITAFGRLSIFFIAIHVIAWIRYVATLSGRPNTRLEKGAAVLMGVYAALALVPNALIDPSVSHHRVAWLGVTYADAHPTPLGELCYASLLATFSVPLLHYIREWRAGVPGAATHAIGLAVFGAAALNDSLAAANVVHTAYFIDVGFLAVVVAVGGATVRRFVGSARSLEQLSHRLERDVEARTRDLVVTQAELMRAEKLAALGRLSAGVAHEINNPAAAIVANLSYLRDYLEERKTLPEDGLECIQESLMCTDRIAGIVRQLLNASRSAGQRRVAESFSLATALASAATASSAALGDHVVLESDVPDDLHVLGESELLEQALVNVIVNAAQAIEGARGSGRIHVTTERRGERVLVRVSDDGPGMTEGTTARLFEPFFTTKSQGKGTGLGLAVSRGLVRTFGGELAVESTSSHGTTMLLDLPIGSAPTRIDSATRLASEMPRHRLLVVDDDPSVRSALDRALGRHYVIELADGVAKALERVSQGSFDLVLCDVMMPDGGAPRFLSELEKISPALASATIFFTAGVTTPDSRAFVEAHAERVLQKPVDPAALKALVRRLLGGEWTLGRGQRGLGGTVRPIL